MSKPYVISAELESLGAEYLCHDRVDDFRSSLTSDLESMGKLVEWVDYRCLKTGIDALLTGVAQPVIGLDDRYLSKDEASYSLGVSRAVSAELEDSGYDSRIGYLPIAEQFVELEDRFSGREVVVVDDVIFSGDNVCWIIDELQQRRVKVGAVVCGIAIGEASEKLAARGVPLECVTFYDGVDDEICERDFAIVTGSGRKVAGQPVSALYFDDRFGKPAQWASIDESSAQEFCLRSLDRNRLLINGNYPLSAVGNFLGYDPQLSVQRNIDFAIALRC